MIWRKDKTIRDRQTRLKALRAIRELTQNNPTASDIFPHLGQVKDRIIGGWFLRLFLRIASIDDLYCLIRFGTTGKKEAWEILSKKLEPNSHAKVILVQIATEISDFASLAIERLDDLGLTLTSEDIDALLTAKHVRLSDSLKDNLTEKRRAEEKRVKKIGKTVQHILALDQSIRS